MLTDGQPWYTLDWVWLAISATVSAVVAVATGFLARYRRCPIQLASSDRELSVFRSCLRNSAGVKPLSCV